MFDRELFQISLDSEFQSKLFGSLVIVLLLWLIRLIAVNLLERRIDDLGIRYRWRKTLGYVLATLALFLVGRIWLDGVQSLATYLGLLSAGLAIALQGPITNLAGWLHIIWRRPFEVGDRLQLGEHAGDVIDVAPFRFTMLEIGNWVDADQSTGRVLQVPNSKVFTEVVANYTKGFEYIWNEIPVLITFESNWRKAKKILREIVSHDVEKVVRDAEMRLKRAERKYMIKSPKLTPIVYTKVLDSGVLLTIRYLTEPRQRRGTEEVIWENILDAVAVEPDIEFAYPTQRQYHRWIEEQVPVNGNLIAKVNGRSGERPVKVD